MVRHVMRVHVDDTQHLQHQLHSRIPQHLLQPPRQCPQHPQHRLPVLGRQCLHMRLQAEDVREGETRLQCGGEGLSGFPALPPFAFEAFEFFAVFGDGELLLEALSEDADEEADGAALTVVFPPLDLLQSAALVVVQPLVRLLTLRRTVVRVVAGGALEQHRSRAQAAVADGRHVVIPYDEAVGGLGEDLLTLSDFTVGHAEVSALAGVEGEVEGRLEEAVHGEGGEGGLEGGQLGGERSGERGGFAALLGFLFFAAVGETAALGGSGVEGGGGGGGGRRIIEVVGRGEEGG